MACWKRYLAESELAEGIGLTGWKLLVLRVLRTQLQNNKSVLRYSSMEGDSHKTGFGHHLHCIGSKHGLVEIAYPSLASGPLENDV